MKTEKDDRRSQRSRRLLNTAMVELMMEKRYDDISVQDILERADVGRSTFYAHYADKEDLLLSSLEHVLGQFVKHVGGDGQMPSMVELFRHVQQNQSLFKAILWGRGAELLYGKGQDVLTRRIQEHLESQAARVDQPAVPIPVIAEYLSGAFLSLLRWWVNHKTPYTPEQMGAMFERLTVPGVMAALQHELPE